MAKGFVVFLDDSDARYLERAMELAERGRGCTSPNPVVGAVIVEAGAIVGEGWHVGLGRDHAEIAAIKDALWRRKALPDMSAELDGSTIRQVCSGTTMYVTLEPCCTQGRTPPCTSALVAGGFARIVAGAIDPSSAVNGRGLELLREAGIQVELAEGAVAHRARRQNDGLRKAATLGLPFVTYKYAMTLDGRVASDSGESRWISSAQSRALVHQWRAWSDAVLVGSGTVAADDPRLTARDTQCARQPLRVVLDGHLSLRVASNLVTTVEEGPVLAVCGREISDLRRSEVESWGVETAAVSRDSRGQLDPEAVCRLLIGRGVQTILLEGGRRIAGAWWAAGLVDKIAAFVCVKVISGKAHGGPLLGPGAANVETGVSLQDVEVHRVGPDVLIVGYTGEPF
jgi:diaminohydroxyphosphoribosylaminopyrimidine deaminase/5-amino-6-(5-phosphoribosylamino)uracil reductase